MHLDNVNISVFVSNVIKLKVILVYSNVLFVEHNKNSNMNNIIVSIHLYKYDCMSSCLIFVQISIIKWITIVKYV